MQGGHSVTRGQRYQLIALTGEECIGPNEECANLILGKGSEGIINIALAASLENMKLLAKGLRRRLRLSFLPLGSWASWIHEHADHGSRRYNLAQQPQLLTLQGTGVEEHAGDITARPVETAHYTAPERVIAGRKNDRYCRGCRFCCERGIYAAGYNYGAPLANQIGRQRRQSLLPIFRPAIFDSYVLTVNKARLI
jgi:hypothetical protein